MKREEDYKLIDELLAEVPEVEIPEDLHFDASLIMKLAEERRSPEREEIRVSRTKNPRRMRMLAGLCASFVVVAGVAYFGLNNLRMGGMKSEAPPQAVDSIAPAEVNKAESDFDSEWKAGQEQPCYSEYDVQKMQPNMDEHPDWYEMLWTALEDESFAEEFRAADPGYGFYICELHDTAESIEFMIYFYPESSVQGFDCENVNNADIRSILWKKE